MTLKIYIPAQKCDWRQQKWKHPGEAEIDLLWSILKNMETPIAFLATFLFVDFVCLTKNLKIRRKRPSLSRCDGNLTKSEKAKNFVKIWQKIWKAGDKIQDQKKDYNWSKFDENVGKCGRCGRQIERSERASRQQSIVLSVAQLDVIRETTTTYSPSSFGHCPI